MSTVPIVYASPNCHGSEASLFDCDSDIRLFSQREQLGQTGIYQNQVDTLENLVGVRCEGKRQRQYSALYKPEF